MGNAIALLNDLTVGTILLNCGSYNELEQELITVLKNKKIPYASCLRELNLKNHRLLFLNHKIYDNENDNSSVIYTKIDDKTFLFMGDASVDVEEDLMAKYNLQEVDVLKVGHHGSKTSSSKNFINHIRPKYAIISVGKNNRYRHPNDSVLNHLEDSKIYRTDLDGSIMFTFKNKQLEVNTYAP